MMIMTMIGDDGDDDDEDVYFARKSMRINAARWKIDVVHHLL